jgi:hypothetical protein
MKDQEVANVAQFDDWFHILMEPISQKLKILSHQVK